MPSIQKRRYRWRTPTWITWNMSCMYHRRMIDKFRHEFSPHGQKWSDKMIAHHERLLVELKPQEPVKYQGE